MCFQNALVDIVPKRESISVCFISQVNRVYPNISAGINDHGAVNGRATGLLLVCTTRNKFGVANGTNSCERWRALNSIETGVCESCERHRALNGKETGMCDSCGRCRALNGKETGVCDSCERCRALNSKETVCVTAVSGA